MNWSKQQSIKILSIICYLVIMLKGSMISLPFGFWLVFTTFEFGNPDQFFAFMGMIGLFISFYNLIKNKTSFNLELLGFILLFAPILRRVLSIPIKAFNYPSFIIPTLLFIFLYWLSVYFSKKNVIDS